MASRHLARGKGRIALHSLGWAMLCLAVGWGAGLVQQEGVRDWYPSLLKSPLTPSNDVFPVVWSTLYVLMGISIGLVRSGSSDKKQALTGLFLLQLALNVLWSITFFCLRGPVAGLGCLTALILLALIYMWQSVSASQAAMYFFLPYAMWLIFAWHLNYYIVVHN